MVEVTDEHVKFGSFIVPHNEYVWRVCTNRHTTTYGNSWGWIENAPVNVCWSDDSGKELKKEHAHALVNAHNKWLEDIQPVQLKIIKAKKTVKDLTLIFKEKEQSYLKAKAMLEKAEESLNNLMTGDEDN